MLVVSLGFILLTTITIGLVPALQMRTDPNDLLRMSGRSVSGDRRFRFLRTTLAALQIAAALALTIGAGVMLETLTALRRADPGFDPANLMTLEFRLPRTRYETGSQQLAFQNGVVERVRSLPDVEGVALVRSLPFSGNVASASFLADSDAVPLGLEPQALFNTVSPDYFPVMGIPLVRGRLFTSADRTDSLPVAIVSRSLANRHWPGRDPIGRRVRLPEYSLTLNVIGVVTDVRHGQLQEAAGPQIYVPYAQRPDIFATLVVRTGSDPAAFGPTVRNAIWSVDPAQPVWKIRTMSDLLNDSISSRRTLMWLLALFGIAALALAGLGTYAVVSQSMRARRREMGIRRALGAKTRDIGRIVLQQAARLSALGIILGIVGTLWLTGLISHLVIDAAPVSAWTISAATGIISAVVLGACALPGWRATHVNPVVVLKADD
jgi:predicted permease